jgi:hypothetical protein
MLLHSLLGKFRKKIFRLLVGNNLYNFTERLNKLGPWYELHKYAPESKYPELLCDWYRAVTGNKLDLNHPRTYNEKLQWLKLYDTTPLKTLLSDKYLVRQWITEKIGEKYLIPLLGVWDNFDEIDFNTLPNQFVLKANHGSGWIIIVKDKSKLDKAAAKRKFDEWMNTNFAYCFGLELQYRDIEPKIIAEQYLEDETGGLADYKFYCLESKPYVIEHYSNRFNKGGYKTVLYDLEWNPAGWSVDAHHGLGSVTKKPENLDEMVRIVNILCTGFHHARVDFYLVNGKLYFGEMTFTSSSGLEYFNPKEWNLKLGDMIKLPLEKANS